MTSKEKLQLLSGIIAENKHELNEYEITDGTVFEDSETRRVGVRIDLRQRIQNWLKESHISQRQLALRLGWNAQNFNSFIKGHKPIPFDLLEEIMWLMESDNIYTQGEQSETRIIKQ